MTDSVDAIHNDQVFLPDDLLDTAPHSCIAMGSQHFNLHPFREKKKKRGRGEEVETDTHTHTDTQTQTQTQTHTHTHTHTHTAPPPANTTNIPGLL